MHLDVFDHELGAALEPEASTMESYAVDRHAERDEPDDGANDAQDVGRAHNTDV